ILRAFDLQTGYEIERSKNGSGPFNYEFHPGLEAQEAEGMTIWDLDDANVPGITGKLHILMLENDVRSSDDVYFKHYTDKFAYPVLYTDSDYGGGPLPLRANLPNLETKGFNDVISSVWVPSGWVIEVFEHAYFEGASTQFRISDSSIHNEGWGDRISSVKIFPPDAKQPTAIPNAPAPVCDGTIVDGYCWYLGREGLSCNDVCASHGGYDSATRTYAGSSGSSVKCWRVITSLNITLDDFYETAQSGRGCFVIRSSSGNYLGYWDELPTTADVPGGQRICACRR
ncbi:MAG TPA: hypothetical protein DCX54_01845, partial [Flavobacteriales bacterium]|nr:hypothetical protein [Flavobacteriales bacterium]